MMINLIGQKFGRLVVVRRMNNNRWGQLQWLCKCDCDKEKVIRGDYLRNGTTKSCNCLRIEKSIKHGHNRQGQQSQIYRVWKHMLGRCINNNDKDYQNYGGRGITVCKRWRKFENFLADIGEPPTKNHSIERINNNGNYCKSNCKWATRTQQNRNTRRNHLITYNNKTQCLSAWAEELNIKYHNLKNRFSRGWSIKRVFTTSINEGK